MKANFEKGCSLGEHPFNPHTGFMLFIDFSRLIPVIVSLPLKLFQRACYRNDYLHIYKSNCVVKIPVWHYFCIVSRPDLLQEHNIRSRHKYQRFSKFSYCPYCNPPLFDYADTVTMLIQNCISEASVTYRAVRLLNLFATDRYTLPSTIGARIER